MIVTASLPTTLPIWWNLYKTLTLCHVPKWTIRALTQRCKMVGKTGPQPGGKAKKDEQGCSIERFEGWGTRTKFPEKKHFFGLLRWPVWTKWGYKFQERKSRHLAVHWTFGDDLQTATIYHWATFWTCRARPQCLPNRWDQWNGQA